MIDVPKVYTVDEAAKALRVSRNTVLRYLYAEQLKGAKIGKSWRISEQALLEFLETGTEPNYMSKLPHPGDPIKRKMEEARQRAESAD